MGAVAEVIDQSSAEEQTKPKSRVSGPLIADQAYGAPGNPIVIQVHLYKQHNIRIIYKTVSGLAKLGMQTYRYKDG